MRTRVLVIAQQTALRAAIARTLLPAGYGVEIVSNEKLAHQLMGKERFEAAVIAPGSTSRDFAFLREVRDTVGKLIILSADECAGKQLAASFPEALVCLRGPLEVDKLAAFLGSPAPNEPPNHESPGAPLVHFEGCTLDIDARTFLNADHRELPLTPGEFALLVAFVRNPGRVLSRAQLRNAIEPRNVDAFDRSIDLLVARLRRKVEPNPTVPRFIITVSGVGYKFAAQVSKEDKSPASSEVEQRTETAEGRIDPHGPEPAPTSAPAFALASPYSEPHRRQLIVLSCGLVGSLASNLDAEELGEILRAFQDICAAVITGGGGTIINCVAGEILALFGHPKAHEDDAERAADAGLELVTKVGEIPSPSGQPLQVRIGIATGLVVVAEDQTAIGGALIAAARVQNLASPSAVTVGPRTHKLLGGVFACEDAGWFELERNFKPEKAYRITGKRAFESRFAARQVGKLTQLVGREHELEQLGALWQLTKKGRGQVALLCGDAGIGKSRFCQAFLDRINDEPHVIVRYQCSPHHINSPFFPIISQLEQATRFEQADTPEQKRGKLEAELSRAPPMTQWCGAHANNFTDELQTRSSISSPRQSKLNLN